MRSSSSQKDLNCTLRTVCPERLILPESKSARCVYTQAVKIAVYNSHTLSQNKRHARVCNDLVTSHSMLAS